MNAVAAGLGAEIDDRVADAGRLGEKISSVRAMPTAMALTRILPS